MSLVKLAYFGKDSQGHAGTGAKIGAGLAAAGTVGIGLLAHKQIKATGGGGLGTMIKSLHPGASNGRLLAAGAIGAGATIGAGALVGGAAGSLVRTKKPGQV